MVSLCPRLNETSWKTLLSYCERKERNYCCQLDNELIPIMAQGVKEELNTIKRVTLPLLVNQNKEWRVLTRFEEVIGTPLQAPDLRERTHCISPFKQWVADEEGVDNCVQRYLYNLLVFQERVEVLRFLNAEDFVFLRKAVSISLKRANSLHAARDAITLNVQQGCLRFCRQKDFQKAIAKAHTILPEDARAVAIKGISFDLMRGGRHEEGLHLITTVHPELQWDIYSGITSWYSHKILTSEENAADYIQWLFLALHKMHTLNFLEASFFIDLYVDKIYAHDFSAPLIACVQRIADPEYGSLIFYRLAKCALKSKNWQQAVEWGIKIENPKSLSSLAYHVVHCFGDQIVLEIICSHVKELPEGAVFYSYMLAVLAKKKNDRRMADSIPEANIRSKTHLDFLTLAIEEQQLDEASQILKQISGVSELSEGLLAFACALSRNRQYEEAVENASQIIRNKCRNHAFDSIIRDFIRDCEISDRYEKGAKWVQQWIVGEKQQQRLFQEIVHLILSHFEPHVHPENACMSAEAYILTFADKIICDRLLYYLCIKAALLVDADLGSAIGASIEADCLRVEVREILMRNCNDWDFDRLQEES